MMLGIAILLFAAALATAQLRSVTTPSWDRMTRFVPSVSEDENSVTREERSLALFRRFLNLLDPSFATIEPLLRSLGVNSTQWLTVIQAGRIAGAFFAGLATAALAGALILNPVLKFAVVLPAFAGFILGVNKLIRITSLNRRRLIRRELILGIEIFCIFLEGGQSLDQTFRSFCEICGKALPYLAHIQRTLVAEIDNGLSYEKAIAHWADNLGIDEGRELSILFTDSLVHGTELVPHLRQFSADMVEQRISGARASIGVKSSQLTVVMVLFFLPAILTFLTAPAFTAVASALGVSR